MFYKVDKLKAAGRYREAGQLARVLGYDDAYGCHFGLQSERYAAAAAFREGWLEVDAALSA